MATPNVSSFVNFVKKYPITLCGFSLLFMPSVYRLLLYFTPLLISTAIFIVAMMTWGPSMSTSEIRAKRRGKRNDYAFNGSLKIYDDDDDDDGGEEEEVSQKGKNSDYITQQEDEESKRIGTGSYSAVSGGQAELDPDLHGAAACSAEPDPDLHGEHAQAAPHNNCSAEPDPDLQPERNSISAISGGQLGDPDLHGNPVGAASCNTCFAEPDPDLLGERVVEAACHNACSAEHDPDLRAEQQVDHAHDQDFSAEKHLHTALDHCHRPTSQDHAESAPINPDQQAAGDHVHYLDVEPDHYEAKLKPLDYDDDAESNNLDCHYGFAWRECNACKIRRGAQRKR